MSLITAENGVQYDSRFKLAAANQEAWDKGEARDPGLATAANGQTMLYVANVPAWHALGQVSPDPLDKHATMRAAGHYVDGKGPLTFSKEPAERKGVPVPGQFWVVNNHTDIPLPKTVGNQHTVVQPEMLYDFAEDILSVGREERRADLTYESAGGLASGRGNPYGIFVSLRLPDDVIFQIPDGREDVIFWFLMLTDYYDGLGKLGAHLTAWRPECKNSVGFGTSQAARGITIRHTRSVEERFKQAQALLTIAAKSIPEQASAMAPLYQTEVNLREAEDLIKSLFPAPTDEKKKAETIRLNKIDAMVGIYNNEGADDVIASVRGTLAGVENAVTHWYDHKAPVRQGNQPGRITLTSEIERARRMVEGDLDDTKGRVRERLLARAR